MNKSRFETWWQTLGTRTSQSSETQSGGRLGPRPGSRVLPGSILFFYKSKRYCFDKKTKNSQWVTTRFLTGFF
jgi:hypothetical protein